MNKNTKHSLIEILIYEVQSDCQWLFCSTPISHLMAGKLCDFRVALIIKKLVFLVILMLPTLHYHQMK
jgi:hypothetical protein